MKIEDIAKVCHAVNRKYCQAIGDMSQVHWEDAPQWQRDSAINGVKYHLANVDASPADSHISWLKEKVETGWVYGPIKDVEKKQHPCCVPYDQLPKEQKAKDYIFSQVIDSLKQFLDKE
jgi:hypothetical protein